MEPDIEVITNAAAVSRKWKRRESAPVPSPQTSSALASAAEKML